MAKAEDLANVLRKKIAENKIVIGMQETKKQLLDKKLEKVIFAKNCPEETKETFTKYCGMTGTTQESIDLNNEELGVLCRKQYPVSVLGVLK